MTDLENKPQLVLSPDEEATLIKLIESAESKSESKGEARIHDFERSQLILQHLIHNQQAIWDVGLRLRPEHFEDIGHARIFKILHRLYSAHGRFEKTVVREMLKDDTRLSDQQFLYLGQLEALYADAPQVASSTLETRRMITEFLQDASLRLLILKTIDKNRKDGTAAALEFLKAGCTEATTLGTSDTSLMNLADFRDIAEAQTEDWIIPGWLEAGCLHLFSAVPKCGKTSTVCNLVASLITGSDWFGLPAKQSPVLFLPFEGKEKFIWENLRLALADRPIDDIKDRFHAPKNRIVPVTGQWLRKLIEATGQKKGTVFIDSARACFPSKVEDWENKASEVRRVMNELTAVALESGWAIVVIHHNNKQDDPSGSTDWKGAVDYVWTMRTEDDSVRKLSIEGRLIKPTPSFAIRKLPDGALERTATTQEEKNQESVELANKFAAVLKLGEHNKQAGPDIAKAIGLDTKRFSELAISVRSKNKQIGYSRGSGKIPAYYWLLA